MDSPAHSTPRAPSATEPERGRLGAGVRIVASVVGYRLRKLEMANLAAAVSIALSLRLPWGELVYRTLFAFVLNVLVYLNNDYCDVALDLKAGDKDADKSHFLAAHLPAARGAQWALFALLALSASLHDHGLFVPLLLGGGACVWYSARLKHRPFTDVLAMMVWGATMPLCGSPADSALGLSLALQLGLFSGVFETVQVLRDREQDGKHGLRTTSVVLGAQRTLLLSRGLMLAVSLYALAAMHPLAALISAGALALPFRAHAVERYWTQIKLVYGVAWLFICAFAYLTGHSGGLLLQVGREAVLFTST